MHVPNWGFHMGMNDRFALLHPKTALLWKDRLQHTLQHCLEEPIHSETFVRHFAFSKDLQVTPRLQLFGCTCVYSSAYFVEISTSDKTEPIMDHGHEA